MLGHTSRVQTQGNIVPELIWEASSDDFVYSVSLSANLDYCAFGGTQRALVVLNGRTGQTLFKVPCLLTYFS